MDPGVTGNLSRRRDEPIRLGAVVLDGEIAGGDFAPPGVARDHGCSTVIEPFLNSCANPGPIERIVAIATIQAVSRDIILTP